MPQTGAHNNGVFITRPLYNNRIIDNGRALLLLSGVLTERGTRDEPW